MSEWGSAWWGTRAGLRGTCTQTACSWAAPWCTPQQTHYVGVLQVRHHIHFSAKVLLHLEYGVLLECLDGHLDDGVFTIVAQQLTFVHLAKGALSQLPPGTWQRPWGTPQCAGVSWPAWHWAPSGCGRPLSCWWPQGRRPGRWRPCCGDTHRWWWAAGPVPGALQCRGTKMRRSRDIFSHCQTPGLLSHTQQEPLMTPLTLVFKVTQQCLKIFHPSDTDVMS